MHLHLNVLTTLILNRYFENFHCVFFIGDTQDEISELGNITKVVYNSTEWTLTEDFKLLNYIDLSIGCQGFVIQSTQAPKLLEYIEYQMTISTVGRFNERRYLLISMLAENNLMEIFTLRELRHVKDMLIVFPGNQNGGIFKLVTHKFVGKLAYNEPILLDVWYSENRTFLYNTVLYPNKVRNLEERTIKLSTFTYSPYDIIGESFETSKGIEISLIKEFIKRVNLTIELINKANEYWGDLYENGTSTGAVGDIESQKSDIATGAIFIRHRNSRADVSTAILTSKITCLVPKPKQITNWLTPFSQFSAKLWILFLMFMVFSSVAIFCTIYLIENRYQNCRKLGTIGKFGPILVDILFNVYRVLVLQPIQITKYFQSVKGLFLCLFLLGLIMSSSYSSGLSSRMVIPSYTEEINKVEDLANSGLLWGGERKDSWTGDIANEERELYQIIVNNFREYNETELKKQRHSGTFGYPIEQLPSNYYAIQDDLDETTLEKLQPMKEHLYWSFSVILARKNFVLLPLLDNFILSTIQYGLLLKWEKEAIMLSNQRLQDMLRYSKEKRTHAKLGWIHTKGIFLIWLIGITLSLALFICEILHRKHSLRRQSVQIMQ